MNTPMIPTPPECGSPCAEYEALAHTNARLRAEVERLRELLSQSLDWVDDYGMRLSGSARLADEIRAELRGGAK